jgi:hypothetical protein
MQADLPVPDSREPSFLRRNGIVLGTVAGAIVVAAAIVVCPRILRNLETADERDARIETVAAHRPAELGACEKRATAYYKRLRQYPTLADGRDATDVMRNRCARDPASYR